MSTRAVIARVHGDGFRGVHHHWDGNPEGLGKSLWELATGKSDAGFAGDLPLILQVLIDHHPAGWSSIIGVDWRLGPGWQGPMGRDPDGPRHPVCYCHGDRHEGSIPMTDTDHDACYAYVFDEAAATMAVLEFHDKGWTILEVVNLLERDEPDWEAMR